VQAAFVLSTQTHATILSIDPSAALALAGVLGYFDHQHLVTRDKRVEDDKDHVFADGLVTFVGQVRRCGCL
jgi:CO/xanthine dehydrogenase Mo-binding subunit